MPSAERQEAWRCTFGVAVGNSASWGLDLDLMQVVQLTHRPEYQTYAVTWGTGSAGSGAPAFVRETAKELMDQFINAYLSVNPRKYDSPPPIPAE